MSKKPIIIISLIFAAQFLSYSEPSENKDLIQSMFKGLTDALMPCWTATTIQHPDSFYIPLNFPAPLFNIKFEDPCHEVKNHPNATKIYKPFLILCFYPISQKGALDKIYQMTLTSSDCRVPIPFQESDSYTIFTAPCYRLQGFGSPEKSAEINALITPQSTALKSYFDKTLSIDKSHLAHYLIKDFGSREFYINGALGNQPKSAYSIVIGNNF